jgi:hypothetical protein
MSESAEVDEEEDYNAGSKKWEKISTNFACAVEIKRFIYSRVLDEGSPRSQMNHDFANEVNDARKLTRKLWGSSTCDADCDMVSGVCIEGSVPLMSKSITASSSKMVNSRSAFSKEGCAALVYSGLTQAKADSWREELYSTAAHVCQNANQRCFINAVVERCLIECVEEVNEVDIRSEPSIFMLHGYPGAGKSTTLKFVRKFFEDICGFTHGVEFVFVTSMHTMADIIGGVTCHSFGAIAWHTRDGRGVNKRKNKADEGMSKLFIRYERLRWIFTDEFPTMGLEPQSEFEFNVRTATRDAHTWKQRRIGTVQEDRIFGGVNLASPVTLCCYKRA